MSSLWVLVICSVAVAGWLIKIVAGRLLAEEAETRLGRIPFMIIGLAAARLPRELRDDQGAEWRAELEAVLYDTEGMPLTRLWCGIRFAAGLLRTAPEIADILRGQAKRAERAFGLVGAAAVIYHAVWLCIWSSGWFNAANSPLGSWLRPIGGEYTPEQMSFMGQACIFGAATGVCVAVWLATRWRGGIFLGSAALMGAVILYYLAAGPLGIWYLILAAAAAGVVAWDAMRRRGGIFLGSPVIIAAPILYLAAGQLGIWYFILAPAAVCVVALDAMRRRRQSHREPVAA